MFTYDAEILAAVMTPPASVGDVLRILQQIEGICIPGDGLKWFNGLYLEVTQAVARVDAGGFEDPAWMAALDVQFAGLLARCARRSREGRPRLLARGARSPQPGRDRANSICPGRRQRPHQSRSAGRDCSHGTAPVHGDVHYRDFTAVNATLQTLIDRAKVELHVRLLGDLLPPVSTLEDTLAAFSMTAAREAAWNNGEVQWSLRGLPAISARTLNMLDGMTTVIGKTLLVPVA